MAKAKKQKLGGALTGPYSSVPTPEEIAAATQGVNTAWNDAEADDAYPYGAPAGWYPDGRGGWTQTPPQPAPGPYDGGDGGGGGGGVLPPYDPATDPSYQQLLAQLGLSETRARAAAAQKIGNLQSDALLAGPRIQEAGIETRRGIDFGAENRGMFRSGARLRDLALQRRGETQRLGDLERGTARQVAGVNQSLEGQIQDIANQRAQADFQARLRAS